MLLVLAVLATHYFSPAEGAERQQYSRCARAADPPICLIQAASVHGSTDSDDLLEAVIATGALELVQPNGQRLVEGAKEASSSAVKFLHALSIDIGADASADQVASSANSVLLAAVALAVAAQGHEEPFGNPIVQQLTTAAGGSAAIPCIAAMLWIEADKSEQGASKVIRPPGLSRIWAAIVAAPPDNSDLLVDLATSAEFYGHAKSDGLALLRIFMQRTNTTPNAKAQAASVLAHRYLLPEEAQQLLDSGGASAPHYDVDAIRVEIAEAKLRRGYDESIARTVVESALSMLGKEAYHSYLQPEPRMALEAAGAQKELRQLGDAYLHRGSQDGANAEERGEWFALASDCYRRGGYGELALAAARSGLRFAAAAVAARNNVSSRAARGVPKVDSQQQAVRANGFGSEPVVALYRAGATMEAVRFGYLRGFDRFTNAPLAGEVPDFQWVIDDRSGTYLNIVARRLVEADAEQGASELYWKIRGQARTPKQLAELGATEPLLAVLAALSGSGAEMTRHLSRAAAALDEGSSPHAVEDHAYFALQLAGDWRRAESILSRHANRSPAH